MKLVARFFCFAGFFLSWISIWQLLHVWADNPERWKDAMAGVLFFSSTMWMFWILAPGHKRGFGAGTPVATRFRGLSIAASVGIPVGVFLAISHSPIFHTLLSFIGAIDLLGHR
jgi:hypothetical protein